MIIIDDNPIPKHLRAQIGLVGAPFGEEVICFAEHENHPRIKRGDVFCVHGDDGTLSLSGYYKGREDGYFEDDYCVKTIPYKEAHRMFINTKLLLDLYS